MCHWQRSLRSLMEETTPGASPIQRQQPKRITPVSMSLKLWLRQAFAFSLTIDSLLRYDSIFFDQQQLSGNGLGRKDIQRRSGRMWIALSISVELENLKHNLYHAMYQCSFVNDLETSSCRADEHCHKSLAPYGFDFTTENYWDTIRSPSDLVAWGPGREQQVISDEYLNGLVICPSLLRKSLGKVRFSNVIHER